MWDVYVYECVKVVLCGGACDLSASLHHPALLIDASVKRLGQVTHMCPKNKSHLLNKTHKQTSPALPSVLLNQSVRFHISRPHSFIHSFIHARQQPTIRLASLHTCYCKRRTSMKLSALVPGGLCSFPTPLHEGSNISSLNPRLGGLSSGEGSEEGLESPSRAWSFSREPCRQKQNMPASALEA